MGRPKKNIDLTEQDVSAQFSDTEEIAPETSEPTEAALPRKVMLSKPFILCLPMPGQSASVTTYYREGKEITDQETIQNLINAGADLYILEN